MGELADWQAAALGDERQRREKAEQQLGKWRQSVVSATSMAKGQDAVPANNSTHHGEQVVRPWQAPNVQRKPHQVRRELPSAPAPDILTKDCQLAIPKTAPSIYDMPSPQPPPPSSPPPSPGRTPLKPKRTPKKRSRPPQVAPSTRRSIASQSTKDTSNPEPMEYPEPLE